ncbi:hypothetical protein ElyMa_006461200 [Elysia marginata]|uniref:Uncharacterized protein n=1 Tax=Elysia marginata TaxID=1093978 RepID=A0AAV4I325_9GAST|nr:hypothetical protein ElyMa_006461200 [Elysia marginata]
MQLVFCVCEYSFRSDEILSLQDQLFTHKAVLMLWMDVIGHQQELLIHQRVGQFVVCTLLGEYSYSRDMIRQLFLLYDAQTVDEDGLKRFVGTLSSLSRLHSVESDNVYQDAKNAKELTGILEMFIAQLDSCKSPVDVLFLEVLKEECNESITLLAQCMERLNAYLVVVDEMVEGMGKEEDAHKERQRIVSRATALKASFAKVDRAVISKSEKNSGEDRSVIEEKESNDSEASLNPAIEDVINYYLKNKRCAEGAKLFDTIRGMLSIPMSEVCNLSKIQAHFSMVNAGNYGRTEMRPVIELQRINILGQPVQKECSSTLAVTSSSTHSGLLPVPSYLWHQLPQTKRSSVPMCSNEDSEIQASWRLSEKEGRCPAMVELAVVLRLPIVVTDKHQQQVFSPDGTQHKSDGAIPKNAIRLRMGLTQTTEEEPVVDSQIQPREYHVGSQSVEAVEESRLFVDFKTCWKSTWEWIDSCCEADDMMIARRNHFNKRMPEILSRLNSDDSKTPVMLIGSGAFLFNFVGHWGDTIDRGFSDMIKKRMEMSRLPATLEQIIEIMQPRDTDVIPFNGAHVARIKDYFKESMEKECVLHSILFNKEDVVKLSEPIEISGMKSHRMSLIGSEEFPLSRRYIIDIVAGVESGGLEDANYVTMPYAKSRIHIRHIKDVIQEEMKYVTNFLGGLDRRQKAITRITFINELQGWKPRLDPPARDMLASAMTTLLKS